MAYDIVQRQFDLERYINKYGLPVLENWKVALTCGLIGLFFSVALTLFIKPEYVSQATILVEEPRSAVRTDVNKRLVPTVAEGSYVLAENEKLKSDTFTAEVLKILPAELKKDLQHPMDFASQIKEGLKGLVQFFIGENGLKKIKKFFGRATESDDFILERSLLAELDERVSISSKSNRAMLWITARTFNQDLAPVLVKTYIDVWTALNLNENKQGIKAEKEFAEEQKRESYLKFKEAENALISFKTRYEIPTELKIAPDIKIQMEMEQLQANLKIAKERFDTMDKLFLEISQKESGIVNNIRILNPPKIPLKPSQRISSKLVVMGGLGGLMLGVFFTLSLDYLKGTIRDESDISEIIKLPIIGRIPKL